jgi:hypothetical protein
MRGIPPWAKVADSKDLGVFREGPSPTDPGQWPLGVACCRDPRDPSTIGAGRVEQRLTEKRAHCLSVAPAGPTEQATHLFALKMQKLGGPCRFAS